MSTLVEGFSWVVERPCPNSDLVVSDVVGEDGSARRVRVTGFGPVDYLSAAEARELAGVLTAAADELAPPG